MSSNHQGHVTEQHRSECVCACSSRKPCLFCKWRRCYRGGMCSHCGLCVCVCAHAFMRCLWMHVCVCVCVCVWVPVQCVFMVLMHAAAEHRGVALLSVTWKSVRELRVQLDTFLTWGEKKRRDRYIDFLCWQWFSHRNNMCAEVSVGVCVLVSCPTVFVSSLLGAHSESQSFASQPCQLWFSLISSRVFHAPQGRVLHVPAGEGRSWWDCVDAWVCVCECVSVCV